MKTRMTLYFKNKEGEWNFPDEFIESLFEKMDSEGKAETALPGEFEPRFPVEFRVVMQNSLNNLYVVWISDKPCGFMWLNRFEHKLARIHFCSFDGFRISDKIEAAEYASDYVLNLKDDKGYLFDVLEGRIASGNKAAQMLVSAAGFRELCIMPHGSFNPASGVSEDAVIYYKTRS